MKTNQHHKETHSRGTVRTSRMAVVLRCLITVALLTSLALAQNMGTASAESPPQDTTPPTATTTYEPEANDAGWHSSPVTVRLNWQDDESGIDSNQCDRSLLVDIEGAAVAFGGGCVNNAHHGAGVEGQLAIDMTPPETEITAMPSASGPARSVQFEFTGTDALSGINGYTCDMEGPLFGVSGPCSSPFVAGDMDPGQYTFRVAASDVAGNIDPTPASFTFTIESPPAPIEFQLTKADLCVGDAINWQNAGEDRVRLQVSTRLSGKDIINVATHSSSYTVTEQLPVGATIFAVLISRGDDGVWTMNDAVPFEPCATIEIPEIEVTSPSANGALCAGDTITFTGPQTGRYRLRLGTSAKGRQIANVNASLADGYTVDALPGATPIHATLYHRPDGGSWRLHDRASFIGCPTAAVAISTTPAAICGGAKITVAGPGTGRYRLRLGTTPDGAELANTAISAQGYTPSELPTGNTIYASLRHRADGGAWTLHHEVSFGCDV